jgi:hypothetical protein
MSIFTTHIKDYIKNADIKVIAYQKEIEIECLDQHFSFINSGYLEGKPSDVKIFLEAFPEYSLPTELQLDIIYSHASQIEDVITEDLKLAARWCMDGALSFFIDRVSSGGRQYAYNIPYCQRPKFKTCSKWDNAKLLLVKNFNKY